MTRDDFKRGVVFRRKPLTGEGEDSPWHYLLDELDNVHMFDPNINMPKRFTYVGSASPTRNNKGFNLEMLAITHLTKSFVKFSDLEVVS